MFSWLNFHYKEKEKEVIPRGNDTSIINIYILFCILGSEVSSLGSDRVPQKVDPKDVFVGNLVLREGWIKWDLSFQNPFCVL